MVYNLTVYEYLLFCINVKKINDLSLKFAITKYLKLVKKIEDKILEERKAFEDGVIIQLKVVFLIGDKIKNDLNEYNNNMDPQFKNYIKYNINIECSRLTNLLKTNSFIELERDEIYDILSNYFKEETIKNELCKIYPDEIPNKVIDINTYKKLKKRR